MVEKKPKQRRVSESGKSAVNVIARSDPKTIVAACEAAFKDPSNQKDCNLYVKAVANLIGDSTFGAGHNADTMIDDMANSSAWAALGADGVRAKADADAGRFVIAGLKSGDHKPPRKHGHVAVVITGQLAQKKYPLACWGSLSDPPGPALKETINFAWNASDRDNILYFSTELTASPASALVARRDEGNPCEELRRLLVTINDIVASQGRDAASRLFPNGVELIDLELTVSGGITVKVKVAGPKATATESTESCVRVAT